MIAIIGASGFIGRNIQNTLKHSHKKYFKDVLMVYFKNPSNILEGFNKISFDDFIKDEKIFDEIDTLIIVAGNSKTNMNSNNFYEFIKKDTHYILEMKNKIKCNVIFLSSGAVYDGMYGTVYENESVSPTSLYGICKYNSEMAIKYIMKDIKEKKLIIYRLMYGYGKFERDNRLMCLIKNCIKENQVLKVTGYNNYLNPISAEFISNIILNSAKNISIFPSEEIINLTSLKKFKLLEILNIINSKHNLKYNLVSKEPSISYCPSSDKLKYYLKKLGLQEEDTKKTLITYFS
ncbi:NAD(P)-dependent oxidoreductase [Clostridium botulinum]|nr:NAD(P)-dependent oxidoreductase [Clostridium botulinum]